MGNVFGIMSERFSILQKHFALNTGKAEIIVPLTAYALHIVYKSSVKTNTCQQAQMIRRISKVTLQSIVIGSVALLP